MPIWLLLIAAAPQEQPRGALKPVMLEVHNAARTAVGVAPLAWSDALAADALAYAREMARSGRFAHADQPKGKPRQGENLWMGTRARFALREMAGHWVDEKRWFVNRPTPEFSTTGRWGDVAHYTQIVWAGTTQVGCGFASSRTNDYLVCRYSPPGNVVGRKAY